MEGNNLFKILFFSPIQVYDSVLTPKMQKAISNKLISPKNKCVYVTVNEFFRQDPDGFKKVGLSYFTLFIHNSCLQTFPT